RRRRHRSGGSSGGCGGGGGCSGGSGAEAAAAADVAPEVEVAQGRMRGAVVPSRLGRRIYAFRSNPYAQPTGRSAALHGFEDCLYLNVYTPKLEPNAKLPVLVYIHGGGFFAGSGASYFNGPQYLLDHDLVFTEALRWVKRNIAAFGGDPGLVTIMGQSAGAASVHFHMLSPLSKGLFHRAISQSGSALASWAKTLDPAPIALQQAHFLGNATLAADLNERWDELMPELMELDTSAPPEAVPALWRQISDFYFGNAQPHVSLEKPQPFIDACRTAMTALPAVLRPPSSLSCRRQGSRRRGSRQDDSRSSGPISAKIRG
ncbi:Esterase FE4, partial [Gryllus bimaculatus]